MKKLNFLITAIFATVLFVSCSNDDETVAPVNEEEVLTTMTVTLTPNFGGSPITVSGNLATGITYNGTILLLNETVNPPENITDEVEEEDLEHQFFYTLGSGLDATTAYSNFDSEGNPLGTEFTLITGAASSGTLTFTLRHEPTKPNDGISANQIQVLAMLVEKLILRLHLMLP